MAFVDAVHIRNFRCVVDAKFDLEPFTVFVGANGSGKSTLLEAFSPGAINPRNRGHDSGNIAVGYEIGGAQKFNVLTDSTTKLNVKLNVTLIRLTLAGLRQQPQAARHASLEPDGSNLANVLSSLGRRRLGELATSYCELVPIYQDVDVQPTRVGQQSVVFQDRWQASRWYQPHEVSDGSLIMLAMLAACAQEAPPDILAIDEMERGLHPYLLQQLVRLCRELTTGKFGVPAQVIGATHSPQLLDFLDAKEVRFVSRDRDTGGTVVTAPPTTTPEWSRAIEAYNDSLGDLWLSGALGGVVGR